MHSWEAIENALKYIEDHIGEELTTNQLSDMVGLSPFYFQRLFKRLVKKTVQEYINLRRLAHSVEYLNRTEKRIVDIAFECGYSSHANYTRAFKETFGITPNEYRSKYPAINTFIKPEIALNYTDIDEGIPLIAGNIILEINRKKILEPEFYLGYEGEVSISGQTPAGEVPGIDVPGELWKQFHDLKSQTRDLFTDSIELGVSHSPNVEKDLFMYFTGGHVEKDRLSLETGMELFVLESGEYIVCKIEADSFENLVTNALYQANKYLYDTWFPKHKLVALPIAAEKYFMEMEVMPCMELWVKIS